MITQIKPVQIVVLAAGIGKRMGIDVPKVLIPLKSKVLINYLLDLKRLKNLALIKIR